MLQNHGQIGFTQWCIGAKKIRRYFYGENADICRKLGGFFVNGIVLKHCKDEAFEKLKKLVDESN